MSSFSLLTVYLNVFKLAKWITWISSYNERPSAEGTCRIMFFPCRYALEMKIFFASWASIQCLSFFVHFCETYCTVCIILEINLLFGLLLWLLHSRLQSFGQLLIKDIKSSLWYFQGIVEVVQNLHILCHLGYNKIYVLAWLLFHSEINTSTFQSCVMNMDSIVWSWCLN